MKMKLLFGQSISKIRLSNNNNNNNSTLTTTAASKPLQQQQQQQHPKRKRVRFNLIPTTIIIIKNTSIEDDDDDDDEQPQHQRKKKKKPNDEIKPKRSSPHSTSSPSSSLLLTLLLDDKKLGMFLSMQLSKKTKSDQENNNNNNDTNDNRTSLDEDDSSSSSLSSLLSSEDLLKALHFELLTNNNNNNNNNKRKHQTSSSSSSSNQEFDDDGVDDDGDDYWIPKYSALQTMYEIVNDPLSMSIYFGGGTVSHRNENRYILYERHFGASDNNDDECEDDTQQQQQQSRSAADRPTKRLNVLNGISQFFQKNANSQKKKKQQLAQQQQEQERSPPLNVMQWNNNINTSSNNNNFSSSSSPFLEPLLEALFRFICLHSQDDTLAASRRIVSQGTILSAAVHIAARLSAHRSVTSLTSWFLRQSALGSLAAPDLASGLVRAARRCNDTSLCVPFNYNNKRKSISRSSSSSFTFPHEAKRVDELASWTFLLLHHGIFHPKQHNIFDNNHSNNNVDGNETQQQSKSRNDLLDAAFAFASVLCPKARNALESTSPLDPNTQVLHPLARRIVSTGLILSLAWAKLQMGFSFDEKRDLSYFTLHFKGLKLAVDHTHERLKSVSYYSSLTSWLASTVTHSFSTPAVSRWLHLTEFVYDGGIEALLNLNRSYSTISSSSSSSFLFAGGNSNSSSGDLNNSNSSSNDAAAEMRVSISSDRSNTKKLRRKHFASATNFSSCNNWLPWSVLLYSSIQQQQQYFSDDDEHGESSKFLVVDRVKCWC